MKGVKARYDTTGELCPICTEPRSLMKEKNISMHGTPTGPLRDHVKEEGLKW